MSLDPRIALPPSLTEWMITSEQAAECGGFDADPRYCGFMASGRAR